MSYNRNVKLSLTGFTLIFLGFIIIFADFLLRGLEGSYGGILIIGPIPIIFGKGEYGAILALASIFITIILIILFAIGVIGFKKIASYNKDLEERLYSNKGKELNST